MNHRRILASTLVLLLVFYAVAPAVAQGLLELVAAPEDPAGAFHLGQRPCLCLREITGILQQRSAGALERLRDVLVR